MNELLHAHQPVKCNFSYMFWFQVWHGWVITSYARLWIWLFIQVPKFHKGASGSFNQAANTIMSHLSHLALQLKFLVQMIFYHKMTQFFLNNSLLYQTQIQYRRQWLDFGIHVSQNRVTEIVIFLHTGQCIDKTTYEKYTKAQLQFWASKIQQDFLTQHIFSPWNLRSKQSYINL